MALRPEEPQSLRDLALLLAQLGQYSRSIELLSKVVMEEWDRFDGIEVIALNELNRILPMAKAAGLPDPDLDPRLIRRLEADLRVVLTWDADSTDMDLWVTEPTGEKASYKNQQTQLGGLVSRDFTEGYGPEEYVVRKAIPGKYRIEVDYFGSDAQKLQGPVTVQVEIFTNFGRPNETRKSVTLRLTDEEEVHHIADIDF